MNNKQKYTPIEVVKEIVDTLKPKIENDIEELKKIAPLFSGSGASKASGFGALVTGGTAPPPPPTPTPTGSKMKKEEMEDHKDKSADYYVKMIMSKKYQVQDVMKMVPKNKRDDVLSAIRAKAGKKMYKNGLKKMKMNNPCDTDSSKKK